MRYNKSLSFVLSTNNGLNSEILQSSSTLYITTVGAIAIVYGYLVPKIDMSAGTGIFNLSTTSIRIKSKAQALQCVEEVTSKAFMMIPDTADENDTFKPLNNSPVAAGNGIRVSGVLLIKGA